MSDGDGGVRGEQKVGHRLANDVGATDDDCIEAGKILAVNALDQQHRAGRCAGHEGRVDLAGAELADIDKMEAVDVLFRRNRLDNLASIDVTRKRQLHQNAVDRPVMVQNLDEIHQVSFADIRRQRVL